MSKKGSARFDTDLLREILEIFESSGVATLELETENFKIKLSKYTDASPPPIPSPIPVQTPPTEAEDERADQKEENFHYIRAPMVGTFYRAPAPGAEPFVKEGDRVKKGDVVCIIEAMKIMNEIKSDVDGVIEEVLVENAHPVEYGQPLFKVRPA
ncbi:MAG: acetyl-CoA carboxylase biotin carboxyl carrier protein [Thermotogae bacterium]|nr:acetyl-CoA carboxylase biotin carboxyl carrier protein [Thermotogota bacterium]